MRQAHGRVVASDVDVILERDGHAVQRSDDPPCPGELGIKVLRPLERLVEEDLGEGVRRLVRADSRADEDEQDVGRGPAGLLLLDVADNVDGRRAEDGLVQVVRDARRLLLHHLLPALNQLALFCPASMREERSTREREVGKGRGRERRAHLFASRADCHLVELNMFTSVSLSASPAMRVAVREGEGSGVRSGEGSANADGNLAQWIRQCWSRTVL